MAGGPCGAVAGGDDRCTKCEFAPSCARSQTMPSRNETGVTTAPPHAAHAWQKVHRHCNIPRTCQLHAMMTMKHAKTLMQRRNTAPHYGFKRSKSRMTARNRLCFLDSAWKDVDRRSVHCRRPDNDAHAGEHHTLQISPPSPAVTSTCHHVTYFHTCVR